MNHDVQIDSINLEKHRVNIFISFSIFEIIQYYSILFNIIRNYSKLFEIIRDYSKLRPLIQFFYLETQSDIRIRRFKISNLIMRLQIIQNYNIEDYYIITIYIPSTFNYNDRSIQKWKTYRERDRYLRYKLNNKLIDSELRYRIYHYIYEYIRNL